MSVATVRLFGGLDLTAPPNAIDPGRSIVAINYETPDTGGYRSIKGYELLGGGAPTGTGTILGLTVWQGDIYCIRENAGTGTLYKLVSDAWVSVATGLPTGGRYSFAVGNFYALAASENLFMVCDQGKPYMWDGTTLTELVNAPTGAKYIAVYSNHLFVGIEAGSLQWSALGDPTDWTALNGAGEAGVSDTITGLNATTSALMIAAKGSIKILYGTSSADFTLKDFTNNVGVAPYSLAAVGTDPIFKTEKGLSSLQAVQSYADFAMGDWANHIAPLFRSKGDPVGALASRNTNQYRLYFADGTGIVATFSGQQLVGITTIVYPDSITMVATGDDPASTEDINIFADDTGQVFRMDRGTSFNGANINTYLTTAYAHYGSPTVRKRFRRIYLDVVGESAMQISVLPSYNFGDELIPRHRVLFKDTLAAGGLWDFDTWDSFAWGTPILDMSHLRLTGTASHIGLVINTSSSTALQHTIHGYTIHFDERRLKRA